MNIVILHLSDIHLKTSADHILKKGKDIASCVFSSLLTADNAFIVISGDLAFSGKQNQYDSATIFLNEIKSSLVNEKNIPISFIVAPGNHDCDFNANDGARNMLVQNLGSSENPDIDESVINKCTSIQNEFFKFRNNIEACSKIDDDLLWRSNRIVIGDKTIEFVRLNTSWVSKSQEMPGLLYFPINRYMDKVLERVDLRMFVLHHPFAWIQQTVNRSFKTFVRSNANIIFSGHEHFSNAGTIDESDSGKSAFIEGGELQDDHGIANSSFNVIKIDLENNNYSCMRYKWNGTRYTPIGEESELMCRPIPAKLLNPFQILNSYQVIIDDPGAYLKHPGGSNITLSDIYIYPDLIKSSNVDDQRNNIVNSKKLLSPDITAAGILLEGEEKAGRTSLLYQFYRYYHDKGFVPLIIKGKYLSKTHEAELTLIIEHEIGAQYGKDKIIAFNQLETSKKLLLIDDFDDSPLKSTKARKEVLCSLKKRFGHMVVAVNEMFEIRELLDSDVPVELTSLEHYKIMPFGYSLRSQLIERWFTLANDGTIDDAKFIGMCDQAERLMNSVMTKMMIPSVPLYLLTLLQSIEAGRSGDFKETALGYYYQYLITQAFQSSGVKPDKLTEVFQYSAHLAWEYHLNAKKELSEQELREFNTKFSKEWHTVDFNNRTDLLLKARILYQGGDCYSFRYPYVYYYLKGQYLKDNLASKDIQEYIKHCCEHLYVRDNANTVLFLAHHSNDEFVIDNIVETLHKLFENCTPITFNEDTLNIGKLITDAPKLIYDGESPSQFRKQTNTLRDGLDDGKDGLAEAEEDAVDLSLIAKMTVLFKTTEILGQVIKNQYAKIQRSKKSILLRELFDGQLRALKDFYRFCEENPDALISEVEMVINKKGIIQDKEACEKLARKIVSGIVQIVSFSFIMRAAHGANSDSLSEDVQDLIKQKPSLAYKLIDICINLDSPKPLPQSKLMQLHKEAKNDLIADRLINIMVTRRLYMFKTTEHDMQWLSNKLKLDIRMQHAITYQDKKRRLLK